MSRSGEKHMGMYMPVSTYVSVAELIVSWLNLLVTS
jgi:hypothetical protein